MRGKRKKGSGCPGENASAVCPWSLLELVVLLLSLWFRVRVRVYINVRDCLLDV